MLIQEEYLYFLINNKSNRMKKILHLFIALLISITFFSNSTSAQPAPGGSGDGGGVSNSPQPCPVSFKRNNGNGTCGGDAQIRLSFNQLPEFAPTLVGILYDGVEITTVHMPVIGDVSNLASKGYISYCLSGSNIPPAKKLVLHFRYPGTDQDDCVVVE